MTRLLPVGRVSKPHGLDGCVKVHVFDADSPSLGLVTTAWLQRGEQRRQAAIVGLRQTARHTLLTLDGVTSVEQAEALRGWQVLVDRGELPPLERDEYYYDDLIGLKVVSTDGQTLGRIVGILPAGGQDVYVCHDDEWETMIPGDDHHVQLIDLDTGQLVVGEIDPAFRQRRQPEPSPATTPR